MIFEISVAFYRRSLEIAGYYQADQVWSDLSNNTLYFPRLQGCFFGLSRKRDPN